ncbi:MAG: tetratricopeptide repeat protein [Asgard group archaeon]|nr:tetratricopeptide repeat protein [Asgard group archaeon]
MGLSLNEHFETITRLYQTANFNQALNEILNLKNKYKKNQKEYYQLLVFQYDISRILGDYSVKIVDLDKLIKKAQKRNYNDIAHEFLLLKIKYYNDQGKNDEMIQTINYGESLLKSLKNENQQMKFKAHYHYLKGIYFNLKGQLETAKSNLEEALTIYRKQDLAYSEITLLITFCSILRSLDEKEKMLEYLKDAMKRSVDNNFKLLQARALATYGIYYSIDGNLSDAIASLQKSLELNKAINSPLELARINLDLGVTNHFSGNLNSALSYYKEALTNYTLVGTEISIAATNYNIGLIYNLQGELKKALESFEEALPIFQKVGSLSLITASFNSMGKIFYDLDYRDEAESHLQLVYQLKKEITKVAFSKTLFYFVPVLITLKKYDKAKDLVNELKLINDEEKSETVKHRYLVLKAKVDELDDSVDKNEIESIYKQVINEPISDQETTLEAIISYIHFLIEEYNLDNNKKEILERIKYYNERLSKLAIKQQSKLLFVEHFWIKSIIAKIEGDESTANELLNQAKKMAKEMDFMRLLNRMKS